MSNTSTYIGIDPATINTGIAILEDYDLLSHSLITVNTPKDAFKRIPIMTSKVEEALLSYFPCSVNMEYSREGTHGVDILVKLDLLVGSLWRMFESHGCTVTLMLPSEWRSRIGDLLKGKNVKRDELKRRAQQFVKDTFNIEPSIDEAEAICIAYAGIE